VAAFLLTSLNDADQWFGVAIYPLTALCSTHPVWFWIASLAMFSDIRTLHRSHLVALGVMATLGVLYQTLLAAPTAPSSSAVYPLGIVFGMGSLAFACLAPWSVYRGLAGDLDERRRRIRRWFIPAASLYLAVVVATQLFVLISGRQTPLPLVVLNIAVIDAVALLALSTFVRFRVVNLARGHRNGTAGCAQSRRAECPEASGCPLPPGEALCAAVPDHHGARRPARHPGACVAARDQRRARLSEFQ
jgi:hypothetical protein